MFLNTIVFVFLSVPIHECQNLLPSDLKFVLSPTIENPKFVVERATTFREHNEGLPPVLSKSRRESVASAETSPANNYLVVLLSR